MASRTFGKDRTAVRQARMFVDEELERAGPDDNDIAVLLTSELVSNVLLHARSAPTVTVVVEGHRIRVEVADDSPALPIRKGYGPDATTGRGLILLETLASAWGAEPTDRGKCVWFELDVAPSAADASADRAERTLPAGVDGVDLNALAAMFGEDDAEPGDGREAQLRERSVQAWGLEVPT